jgi:hypothetical protein
VLEQHFEKYKYPNVKRRKVISDEIGLPEERIQIWFQNRRVKDKRQLEQQVKLQKLVDEAIGGTQEGIQNNVESGKYSMLYLNVNITRPTDDVNFRHLQKLHLSNCNLNKLFVRTQSMHVQYGLYHIFMVSHSGNKKNNFSFRIFSLC